MVPIKCPSIGGMLLAGALSAYGAGENAGARLYVDLDCATPDIDSAVSRGFPAGSGGAFWVAVSVIGAKHLYNYSFLLDFDPSRLEFVRAEASVPEAGFSNFTTSKDGNPGQFHGSVLAQNPSQVYVGNTLIVPDTAWPPSPGWAPSGSGPLAYIQFRARAPGSLRFDLHRGELLDSARWREDTPNAGATLELTPATAIGGRAEGKPWARREGNALVLDWDRGPADLRIVDMRGRERFRWNGLRGRQSLDLAGMARPTDRIWLRTPEGSISMPLPGAR